MGNLIVGKVLECLRRADFRADAAFPGENHTAVTEAVAAVHLEKIDRGNARVVAAVYIYCPAALGGSTCEEAGLRAVAALDGIGAECVMNGCEYDGNSRCYGVKILAEFSGVWGNGGFSVTVGTAALPHAVEFSAEELRKVELRYVMGETAPAGVGSGPAGWELTLVEKIPAGEQETSLETSAATISVVRSGRTEVYQGCVWTSVKREFSRGCLVVTRKGIATGREVM